MNPVKQNPWLPVPEEVMSPGAHNAGSSRVQGRVCALFEELYVYGGLGRFHGV